MLLIDFTSQILQRNKILKTITELYVLVKLFFCNNILIIRRHGQVVRQKPAKLLSPVRIWVSPFI